MGFVVVFEVTEHDTGAHPEEQLKARAHVEYMGSIFFEGSDQNAHT